LKSSHKSRRRNSLVTKGGCRLLNRDRRHDEDTISLARRPFFDASTTLSSFINLSADALPGSAPRTRNKCRVLLLIAVAMTPRMSPVPDIEIFSSFSAFLRQSFPASFF